MNQPPDHRPNPVEKHERFGDPVLIDHAGTAEQPKVNVDFLGRSVGDPVVIETVFSAPPVAFRKVTAPLRGLCRTPISLFPQPPSLRDDDAVNGCSGRDWPEPMPPTGSPDPPGF